MKLTPQEQFIHDYLVNEGHSENQFGVVSADNPGGGYMNLTYVICDAIKANNERLIKLLGDATADNGYDLTVSVGEWWMTHKHVGSGEPLEQFLNG